VIRLGPITIMRSRTHDAYRDVVKYAWLLHQAVWFDQTHDYSELIPATVELAGALSYAPVEDAPK
jgi:hypothetical protein